MRGGRAELLEEGFDLDAFVGGVLVDEDEGVAGLGCGLHFDEDEFLVDLGDYLGVLEACFGELAGDAGGVCVKGCVSEMGAAVRELVVVMTEFVLVVCDLLDTLFARLEDGVFPVLEHIV